MSTPSFSPTTIQHSPSTTPQPSAIVPPSPLHSLPPSVIQQPLPSPSQQSHPQHQSQNLKPSLPSSRSSRTTLTGRTSKNDVRNSSNGGGGAQASSVSTSAKKAEKDVMGKVLHEPIMSWKKSWSEKIERAPATGFYCSLTPAHGSPPPPLKAHTATLVGDKIYIIGGCLPSSVGGCFRGVATFNIYTNLWSQLSVKGELPPPIRAHTSVAVGEKIWIFGGGDREEYSNLTYCFDTRTSTFTKPPLSTPPSKIPSRRRAHSAAFIAPSSFIIFGGGDGGRALNDAWIFDTSRLTWELVPVEEKRVEVDATESGEKRKWVKQPGDRGYHSGHYVPGPDGEEGKGKMIVYGGSDGMASFATIDALDLKTFTWHRLDRPNPSASDPTPLSFARAFHASIVVSGLMFVIGGHDSQKYYQQILCYDLRRRKWLPEKQLYGCLPPERGYHSLTYADGRLFIYGGSNGSSILGDLWTIDLASHAALLYGPPVSIDLESNTAT